MNHDEAAKLLGPYRDGELDLATCLKLEEHMADCPSCQLKLAGEQEIVDLIQSETPRFKASPFLKTRIQASLREEKSSTSTIPWWKRLLLGSTFSGLAGATAMLVILAVGFFSTQGIPELDQEAVANHVRSLQVNHLMDVASTDQHTVKPWFAGKLNYSPQVIDLTSSGYPLVGGRLDVLDGQNVAAIVYGRRKHFINLFIWPSNGRALPSHPYALNGYHVLGWTEGGMNYLAVSELGEQEFEDFAKLIQDQTSPARPGE